MEMQKRIVVRAFFQDSIVEENSYTLTKRPGESDKLFEARAKKFGFAKKAELVGKGLEASFFITESTPSPTNKNHQQVVIYYDGPPIVDGLKYMGNHYECPLCGVIVDKTGCKSC